MTQFNLDAALKQARDPATPPDQLIAWLDLGETRETALQNPSLWRHLIERPDLWASLMDGTQEAIAASPRCPLEFVQWALRQSPLPELLVHAVVQNGALPAAARRGAFLAASPRKLMAEWPDVRAGLGDFVSADELSLLDRTGLSPRHGWPSDSPLTVDELGRLSLLGRVGRALALAHPGLTAEARAALEARG